MSGMFVPPELLCEEREERDQCGYLCLSVCLYCVFRLRAHCSLEIRAKRGLVVFKDPLVAPSLVAAGFSFPDSSLMASNSSDFFCYLFLLPVLRREPTLSPPFPLFIHSVPGTPHSFILY